MQTAEQTTEPVTAVATTEPPETDMEVLKYKEELLAGMGLPSSYAMGVLKNLCQDLVASGFAPAHFNRNPMALFLAAMRGREMELAPIESIMETFWAAPGGRLGMYSNKMLDIMHRRGVKSKFITETKDRCEILFTPPGDFEPYTAVFEFEEARTAGLVKADKPDSNWFKWPSDMCKARAIARGWRALAGSFKGAANLYAKEELEDMEYTPVQTNIPNDQPVVEVAVGKRRKSMTSEPPPPGPVEVPRPVVGVFEIAGTDETPQANLDTAMLRAQAVANEKKAVITVNRRVILSDGTEQVIQVGECQPGQPAAPQAAPMDPAKRAYLDRAEAAYARLPGDEKTRKQTGDMFCNGFYGVSVPKEWPRNIDDRTRGVAALEAAIQSHPGRFETAVSARDFGREMANPLKPAEPRTDPSEGLYSKLGWSLETRAAAAAFKLKWESDAQDFADYTSALKLDTMADEDVRAYLTIGAVMGRAYTPEGSTVAAYPLMLLTELSDKGAGSYADIASALELGNNDVQVSLIPPARIMAGLQKMLDRLNAAAPKAATATAAPDDDNW